MKPVPWLVSTALAAGCLAVSCGQSAGPGAQANKGGTASASGGESALSGSAGQSAGGGADGAGGDRQSAGAAGASAGAGTGGGTTVVSGYEAEDAFFFGGAAVATDPVGFSGAGFVSGLSAVGERVVFTVQVADAGDVDAVLTYRNAGAASAKLAVLINGAKWAEVTLESGTDFQKAKGVALPLRAGLNTVAYVVQSAGAALDIDSLSLAKSGFFAERGATVPFQTYEAEDGVTTGSSVGPERAYGSVAAEASGRKAVKLEAEGSYVELRLTRPANALVLRYSMPDAAAGGGADGALGLYVDGEKRQTLSLSSKYAWVYGAYPFDNDPSHGAPHRYFDEVRASVTAIPAGAVVRLQKEAGDATPYYVVDLLDFEQAPEPYAQPAGTLSIADFGAQSGDAADDTQGIKDAISAAKQQGKAVWIPAGDFSLTQKVDLDGVTLRGAGPWYSVLHGKDGKGGFNGLGGAIQLLDFALFGDVSYRDDGAFDAGMDGRLGPGSLIQNVWFEHTKVGVWTIGAHGTLIVGCRIHDTFADGINLTGGTKQTTVLHVHVRNSGDDAFAMWSNSASNEGSAVRFSTAELPMLANGVAAYGGKGVRIEDNLVSDTVTASAGIAISTRSEFSPQPFSGTTSVERNTLRRTGGYEPNWKTAFGAFWIFASQSAISSVSVKQLEIVDSSYQGLLLSGEHAIDATTFEGVSISNSATFGIEVTTSGEASFERVSVVNAISGAANIAPNFSVTKSAGNSGW